MSNEFDINKEASLKYCPFASGDVKCRGTYCGIFVLGETDGHCAFQILPQLVTELREINNRAIPFSEEPVEVDSDNPI
jgi:hypothetical protein